MGALTAKLIAQNEKVRESKIKQANQEADAELAFLQKLTKVEEKYPDLSVEFDWTNHRTRHFCSVKANLLVNHYELHEGFGGRPEADEPVVVMMYVEEDGLRIYSSPMQIQIGAVNYYHTTNDRCDYIITDENWTETIRKLGIPEKLIEEISKEISTHL